MDFIVEKSCAGTDHFVFGDKGFVAEHEAESWPGCKAGWYAHTGEDGDGNILGPCADREGAVRLLLSPPA